MRFLKIVLLFGMFFTAALSQSTKSKPAFPKTGPSSEKVKPSTKTATAKPKPAATPQKNEKTEWEAANAITDSEKRIEALRKFVKTFPRSTKKSQAFESITMIEAALGNEKLAAGDTEAAVKFIRAAAMDAPKPITEKLFTETLSKFPANLYFRGLRAEGFEIAKIFEGKADTSAGQLLSIAAFYLSVENGAEARRVAENVIKIDSNSSAAYQTRGLANRVDFKLEESAFDYAKALELEPESLSARRGLAEMKRSLGKADEAVVLYRGILAKDDANVPARTGLILALFDADKRADAEAEMAKSLEANPGNVILLAGAAYWYAAHNEGSQAVALAQKAIETDPRFIWSHIAMARGLLTQKKEADAERTLLAARQYGNFPTLEYEIASARLSAGLYREAAEELSKSFSIKDGTIHANLGGRISSDAKNFTDLVGFERKASLFTPTAADSADNAAQLKALIEFEQNLRLPDPKTDIAATAADEFVRGDDKMKVHRQIFAASELLEKRIALPKVLEIAGATQSNLEAGLDIPDPSTAVMASELYENRAIAAASGRYINVPSVPRGTLLAVLRGRIEEISGWASFQMDDAAQAVVHLKRAVGVLPVDSAWWRSGTWRLGTALAASGNDAEALEAYTKSYKSSGPDAFHYNTIESVYKRVKGNTLGLEELIGPNPTSANAEAGRQLVETPSDSSVPVPIKAESTPETKTNSSPVILNSPELTQSTAQPTATIAAVEVNKRPFVDLAKSINDLLEKKPTAVLSGSPTMQQTPDELQSDESKPGETPKNEKSMPALKELFPPVVITIPAAETSKIAVKTEATPTLSATAVDNKPTEELKPTPSPTSDTKVAEPSPTVVSTPEKKSDDTAAVVEPVPQPTAEVRPCTLIIDIENITLKNNEGVLAVIVRREGDQELDELKAVSTSPQDISVRREGIPDIRTQALFVVRSTSAKTGVYQVTFEMPCGKKDITVKVQ